MSGEHWSDIARRRDAAARPAAAVQRIAAQARPTLAGAVAQNPTLARLMEERERLEARMRTAVSGGAAAGTGAPRDALRFQVAPIAQRRAEFAAWSERREALSAQATTNRAPGEPDRPLRERMTGPRPASAPAERAPASSLPLRATPGETPGGTRERSADWLAQRLAKARPVVGKVAEAGRALGGKLGDLDRQFADADRQLAAQGASESDRKELAGLKKDLGFDKLDKVSKATGKADAVLKRATALPDGYKAAGRKLEDQWARRRDAIAGEDHQSYMRPLRALTERVLGMGLPDIEERAAALKGMAQDRRRAAREEAEADDARRERALEKRKAARDGV